MILIVVLVLQGHSMMGSVRIANCVNSIAKNVSTLQNIAQSVVALIELLPQSVIVRMVILKPMEYAKVKLLYSSRMLVSL
jgi:hypothetical protein